jgi:Predicted NADH:ubiquinone oxidoreductase, subunit RnfA
MTVFIQMMFTALAAVAAENILFSGGIGFSRVLRAARRPATLGLYSLFVTVFSLISILLSTVFNPVVAQSGAVLYLRPLLFALCAAAVYLVAAFLVKTLFPAVYRKYGEILSPAAINTVVLAMPYVQKSFKLDSLNAVGFALGTGLSFFLAAEILAHAAIRCRNEDMPKAFGGLPAMLIYIGILSLAFAGFTGRKLF